MLPTGVAFKSSQTQQSLELKITRERKAATPGETYPDFEFSFQDTWTGLQIVPQQPSQYKQLRVETPTMANCLQQTVATLQAPVKCRTDVQNEQWQPVGVQRSSLSGGSCRKQLREEAICRRGCRSGMVVSASAGGRPQPQNSPRSIIIPSGNNFAAPGPESGGGADLYLPFLKPAVDQGPDVSTEEQLQILRDRRGLWHEYAACVTALNRSGYTSATIDESTGMTGVEQNTIVVATQVFNSLKASGLSEEKLRTFETMGGAEVLYETRTLSSLQRLQAAEYMIDQGLDPKFSREVAKAMKEYERRKRDEGRECFTAEPGDCLAFTYYRQSKEARSDPDKEAFLHKALERARSSIAKGKIKRSLGLQDDQAPIEAAPQAVARISLIRLLSDETVSRPVCVVGNLTEIDAAAVGRAEVIPPSVGVFRVFTPSPGSSWIALPAWSALADAAEPIGIMMSDANKLPTIQRSGESAGETLLLVDRASVEPNEEYYFVTAVESGVALETGLEVKQKGSKVLGRVLLSLLPPEVEAIDAEWE